MVAYSAVDCYPLKICGRRKLFDLPLVLTVRKCLSVTPSAPLGDTLFFILSAKADHQPSVPPVFFLKHLGCVIFSILHVYITVFGKE